MKTIIIDTNLLIDCAKFRIDIEKELTRILDFSYTIAILDRTMEELEKIATQKTKEGMAAKLAKTILMTKHITVIPTQGGYTDKRLLELADENHIIATNDKEIKQKLKQKKQPVIIIRGQQKLEMMDV
ncbi:conserved hypothetical protein [sediment metagenome]|uniref:VapC9 PIN-like domain-containing protein n=1 Tax=sediment metagenome TaxID=749907 RepID=D9PM40_9ZZZZ